MADESYKKHQVVHIINSVLERVRAPGGGEQEMIFQELQQLKKIIEEARQELGAMAPEDIQNKHIPTATDELDAVVEATLEATGAIMDSCETIENILPEVSGEAGEAIQSEITKIYESCSFQDITGQRITKVVNTLKQIDEKASALLAIVEHKLPGYEKANDDGQDSGTDILLNGPQLPQNAITQEDIDKLLADFD